MKIGPPKTSRDVGGVFLPRCLFGSEYAKNLTAPELLVVLACVARAAEQDRQLPGGVVQARGTLVTSLAKLSEDTGISTATVKRALGALADLDLIAHASTNRGRTIEVIHYDELQDPARYASVIEPRNLKVN